LSTSFDQIVLILTALAVFSIYGAAVLLRLLNEWQLRRRAKGRLLLTFDDGPSPVATEAIRALLRRESVRGTFFVNGFRSEQHADLIAEAIQEGHDIGSHGFAHLHGWRQPFKSLSDVAKGLSLLRNQYPAARFFRPPWGKATLMTHLICLAKGYRMVYWIIDCKDAERELIRNPEDIVDEFLQRGGGVVLLHDLDIDQEFFPGRNEKVLAICESLIACAKSRGMPISTMTELLEAKT
jgi:peptidoglycan/xylan/chitin deacetylase (PgdA/CDA1 family)